MITKELLDRINELARKKREAGLTEEETEEQCRLRKIYLADIRSQVVNALEASGCKQKAKHGSSCGCPNCGAEH
ncbi:DUF896 domain-containing protein [Pelotomaculum propionicicum]|uniref:DUF896 domain-containing protein n=1 Tax=Pelotomaculum propionicicum TaxID=258475 RepID=UPI003B7C84AB